ncbi:MAG: hypothetical protein FWF75_02390 [Propionibacteriaceae bacterium]|nr:hypothetical protein [Propionibacteriaceae bacterium]
MAPRKAMLVRIDPAVYDALQRWAGADLRSLNAQVEMVLRRALRDAGRLPASVPDDAPAQPEPPASQE